MHQRQTKWAGAYEAEKPNSERKRGDGVCWLSNKFRSDQCDFGMWMCAFCLNSYDSDIRVWWIKGSHRIEMIIPFLSVVIATFMGKSNLVLNLFSDNGSGAWELENFL